MDLVKIAGPAHYLPGRVNIGVLIGEGQAAFIQHTEFEPFFLFGAAPFKAHLSGHVREGRVSFEIHDQRPMWRRLD